MKWRETESCRIKKYNKEVFLERLPEIAKNAVADACTGSNPRQPSVEEMEKLLKCCYYDTEVDF